MTLFNIQNQIAVKVLALVTMLMMVASLVPASVFAQAEGENVPATENPAGDEISKKEDKKDKENPPAPDPKPEQNFIQQIVSTLTNNDNDEKKVVICHATGNGGYTAIEPNINSLKNGHANSGVNAGDIVPPTAGTDFENGQNWDEEGQAIYKNGCEIQKPAEPTEPTVCSIKGEVVDMTKNALKFNGQPVDANRRTTGGLGTVASYSNFFGKDGNGWDVSDFLTLGVNGFVTYEFTDKVVVDQAGPDIAIWEITGGPTNQVSNAKATIAVSQDGVTFVPAGSVTGDGQVDISATGLDFVRFVRVTDNSFSIGNDDGGDGYDVDAITIIDGSCSDTATIVAEKIVCTNEAELPNRNGGADITITTAADWVAANKSCSLVRDWQFEWAQGHVATPGDALTGAAGASWMTFGPTDGTGKTSITLATENLGKGKISLREVLKPGYIPFTNQANGNNSDANTAEFYCASDVVNYDNLEWLTVKNDATYHCVAWNVKKPQETVKVHIYKYLQDGEVTAQVPNDSTAPNFPMVATWNAANIGGGTGNYVLGNYHVGIALKYAAETSDMSVPADYTTSEITGGDSIVLPADAKCEIGKYRLVGYKQGDSVVDAEGAELTATAPVYTDITTDKYVIVVNEKCPDTKPATECKIGKNLIDNGSFEVEKVTDHGGQWEIFSTIAGWMHTLSSGLEIWNTFNGTGNDVASAGYQNAELDGDDATRITQSVTTLIPGATYELSFDYSPRAGTALADSKMATLLDGNTILSLNVDGSANTNNAWTSHSATFVATGTSATIAFEDTGVANANGGYGPLLDNVAVCLVKEPEPLPTCTLTIKSDATDYVVEKNTSAQLLSYIHPSWATSIGTSTANWIWGDNPVVNSTIAETQTFKKGFNWTGGTPTSAVLKVSSDNTHAVTLGAYNVSDMTEFNYGPADITTYNVPVGNIANGANTLAIAVGNMPVGGSNAKSNPAGLMYELTITGTGESCGTIVPEVPKTTGTVTMCKVDEDKKPLSGWTMTLLGDEIQSVNVSALNGVGATTIASLNAGKSYVAVASGTWKNDRTPYPINMVDAEHSTEDTWTTHMDGFYGDTGILELLVNGTDSNWGAYNSGHLYARAFTQAATGTATFSIFDSYYGDNSGNLNVKVYEGYAGITGKDGCVTFKGVPYGEYTADEIMQDGWDQVGGAGEVDVVYGNTPQTITIVNEEEEIVEEPRTFKITGMKINDLQNDGIKDVGEVGIPDWTIYAKKGAEIRTTKTDVNGVYTFNLPAGDWVIYEEIKTGWNQIAVTEDGVAQPAVGEGARQCTISLGNYQLARELRNRADSVVPVKLEVPDCTFFNRAFPVIVDEPESSNGGGNGGTQVRRAGLVAGASTSTPSCGIYLNDYMRMGNAASTTQVTKLQVFLNAVGITAPLTGVFDAGTDAAVRTFQMQHKAEVLTPWYLAKIVPHENPTGWVYQLTRWKINNIVCPGSEAYPVLN